MNNNSQRNPPDATALVCWATMLFLSTIMLMVEYCMQLWLLDQYQLLPRLGLAVGMLFFSRWARVVSLPATWHAWTLLVSGVFSTLIASHYWSPWLGCVGFLLIFGAFLSSCQGEPQSYWGLLPLWPASWMLLRLPLILDYQLTNWLQLNTATISSYLLDRIDIPHRLTVSVFYLPGGPLFVEAPAAEYSRCFRFCFVLAF